MNEKSKKKLQYYFAPMCLACGGVLVVLSTLIPGYWSGPTEIQVMYAIMGLFLGLGGVAWMDVASIRLRLDALAPPKPEA